MYGAGGISLFTAGQGMVLVRQWEMREQGNYEICEGIYAALAAVPDLSPLDLI